MYRRGAYRFAIIWKLPRLGLLLWCHLQDSGHNFQALGSVQHAAMLSEPVAASLGSGH